MHIKQLMTNYCRYWRFKEYTLPKIQKYIDNYVENVLKKEQKPDSKLIPVSLTMTRVSLREPDDTNFQDGLDTQVDWFTELKVLEDIIDPPKSFISTLGTWLSSNMFCPPTLPERIFSRKNFENAYFYFEYRDSSEHKLAKDILAQYQSLMNYAPHCFITKIDADYTISFFRGTTFPNAATINNIDKVISRVERLAIKAKI